MTSKEAFKKLITDSCDFISDESLYDVVWKDLEILELLKNNIVCKDGTTTTFDTRDNRIKEWLEQ